MNNFTPLEVTQHFILTHMEQRNLDDAVSCLSKNIQWFGTGAFEVVHGIDDAYYLLSKEIDSFPQGYTITFHDMSEVMLNEYVGSVVGKVLVMDHELNSEIECRLTTTCVKEENGFVISILHMSLPNDLQNKDEFYPIKIAEQKVKEIRDDFWNTTIAGGLVCCDIEKGFRIKYANDFFVRLLGYRDIDEFINATDGYFVNCFGDGENIKDMEYVVKGMKNEDQHTFTYRVKTKNKKEIWLRSYTQKYSDADFSGILAFCTDITDIIEMENELKKQKSQLEFYNTEIETIISNIPGGVHRCQLFDVVHVDYVSHGFEEMSGYSQEDIQTLFENDYSLMLLEEDREAFTSTVELLCQEPMEKILEYRLRAKSGKVLRVSDHFRSIRMEDGRMWGFGVAIDITKQNVALAQLRLLTDSIPGGLAVYEYSSEGLKTLYFSDGVAELMGYSRAEYAIVAKDKLMETVQPENLEIIRNKIIELKNGSNDIDLLYQVIRNKGSKRWINFRGRVSERHGDIIVVNAVMFDVSEVKEAEEKLRIRDEEYALAVKQSGKTVYRYSIKNKNLTRIQQAEDVFGLPQFVENVPDYFIQENLIAKESINDFINFFEDIHTGKQTGFATIKRKLETGKYGWSKSNFTSLYTNTNDPVSAIISIEDVTKQREQEIENEILKQNEELFQIVVSHSDRFIIKYDIESRTAYPQKNARRYFNCHSAIYDVPNCINDSDWMTNSSKKKMISFYENLIKGDATSKTIVKLMKNKINDNWNWCQFDGSNIYDKDGKPKYAVISFMEITEQYEKELEFERMRKRINSFSKGSLLYFEANLMKMKIERYGGSWIQNLNINFDEDLTILLKTTVHEIVIVEDQEKVLEFFRKDSLISDFREGKTERKTEFRIFHNNQPLWVSVTVEMITDPYSNNILIYILFKDINEEKVNEINIQKLAQIDGMTNVFNRTSIEKRIKQELSKKNKQHKALFIIDIDDLKAVNDTYGHIQGDRAIISFANTIVNWFNEKALIGRIGGDEFVVFIDGVKSEEQIKEMMIGFNEKISEIKIGEHNDYELHGSIGIAINEIGIDNFEILYKKADEALYNVKRQGKNGWVIYHKEMKL
ncbi:MAG: sensor domain-containing diguanylate cyclase [Erysipelotrichaceae bacterium]